MKILGNKTLFVLTIIVQLAFTLHEPVQKATLDIPEVQIVDSDYYPQSQIVALLTKERELKVYQQTQEGYIFLQKVPTCQGSSLSISNDISKNNLGTQSSNLIITIKCSKEQAVYEFDSKTKSMKEVTVKKFILAAVESLMGNVPLRTTRMLIDAAACSTTQVNSANSTVCGDGNTVNGDGCSSDCMLEYCGDAITNNVNEQCDDGNSNSGDGCSDCKLECGNGVINPGEQCDDGNTNSGDGCSSTCKTETASAALPLALGIPVAAVALIGVIVAKCILGKSAAGPHAANAGQPSNLEMEQSTKVLNR